jgi:predicted alpha-1,2-mannosidase
MPIVGELRTRPGSRENPSEGYRSRFRHETEIARPGYYRVLLDDYDVEVELTATRRAGFHRYSFPETDSAHVIIDPFHGLVTDQVIGTHLDIQSDSLITGYRESKGWGEQGEKYWCEHIIYFAAEFSRPFQGWGIVQDGILLDDTRTASGKDLKAFADFSTQGGKTILVRVGISAVDVDGALSNLRSEIPDWDFDGVRAEAEAEWARCLSVVEVEDTRDPRIITFYTALYHTMLAPFLFGDVDGRYRGFDRQVHQSRGFENYTVFSLWDTFRAAHPLLTITQPERVDDFIRSMLAQYEEYGLLPVWPLHGSETNCMIGYHSIPVIVDAYLKGFRGFDPEVAFRAMTKSARQEEFGIGPLQRHGYVPTDLENYSVSKTLEYSFDDWCIARMAHALGKKDERDHFFRRSQAYREVFDTETRFARGRDSQGQFVEPFDPAFSSYGRSDFIEGNSWQYTWFVPHDVSGLIELMGGADDFAGKLDRLFSTRSSGSSNRPMDVTGLIGEYAHGNEPSHHVAYLYNYSGQSWKTQARVHDIMTSLYNHTPEGLCGNEDCGQMSAWYVFSGLGFYPVNPAEGIYVLGTPLFRRARINLPNGRAFEIEAPAVGSQNKFIQAASLNGKSLDRSYIRHEEIMQGGVLRFEMGTLPNRTLWVERSAAPPSMTH